MVRQRKEFLRFDLPIDPAFGLDLASVRFRREEDHVRRLFGLSSHFLTQVSSSRDLQRALLHRTGPRVLPAGVPPVSGNGSVADAYRHMPSGWMTWECQARHRFDRDAYAAPPQALVALN